jgi:hypothetical protein
MTGAARASQQPIDNGPIVASNQRTEFWVVPIFIRESEHSRGGGIQRRDAIVLVERDNSRRQRLQHRLDVITPFAQGEVRVAQLRGAGFDASAVFLELRCHLIERRRQQRQLIIGDRRHAMRQVAARDLVRSLGQRFDRRCDAAREIDRDPARGKQQNQCH